MSETALFFQCPHCSGQTNAQIVAANLPEAVLRTEIARRNGQKQTGHAGPGRPAGVYCPGCENKMTAAARRDHDTLACLRTRMKELQNKRSYKVWLSPKDPDPYPDFSIGAVDETAVHFQKLSTPQLPIAIALSKISKITEDNVRKLLHIRLRGHLGWDATSTLWHFEPNRPGVTLTAYLQGDGTVQTQLSGLSGGAVPPLSPPQNPVMLEMQLNRSSLADAQKKDFWRILQTHGRAEVFLPQNTFRFFA
jgi:hypothetical protein